MPRNPHLRLLQTSSRRKVLRVSIKESMRLPFVSVPTGHQDSVSLDLHKNPSSKLVMEKHMMLIYAQQLLIKHLLLLLVVPCHVGINRLKSFVSRCKVKWRQQIDQKRWQSRVPQNIFINIMVSKDSIEVLCLVSVLVCGKLFVWLLSVSLLLKSYAFFTHFFLGDYFRAFFGTK